MFVESLIGKEFFELDLFELLRFEVEANFDFYLGKYLHLYFDRVGGGKIRITRIRKFRDRTEKSFRERALVDRREWILICHNDKRHNVMLVRTDRTGYIASIGRDYSFMHESYLSWGDEYPPSEPMTPEDIRLAFQDLAGIFSDQIALKDSRKKGAV